MEKIKSENVEKIVTIGGFVFGMLSALCAVFTNGVKAYKGGRELKNSKEG